MIQQSQILNTVEDFKPFHGQTTSNVKILKLMTDTGSYEQIYF